jgi:hypothetical protein
MRRETMARWDFKSHPATAEARMPKGRPLTAAQKIDIYELVEDGASRKQIAADMGISTETVNRVYQKMRNSEERQRARVEARSDCRDSARSEREWERGAKPKDEVPDWGRREDHPLEQPVPLNHVTREVWVLHSKGADPSKAFSDKAKAVEMCHLLNSALMAAVGEELYAVTRLEVE